MSTKKPRYSAYKAAPMTDGLQTWGRHEFDNTKPWTADDVKMFKANFPSSPQARIEAMRAKLAKLAETPAIKVHADAIRAIHASMPHVSTGQSASNEQWKALRRADELWLKIMMIRDVMPKAKKYIEITQGGAKGGFKGGRPSKKPTYVALLKAYKQMAYKHERNESAERNARAELVKALCKEHRVAPTTARKWLTDALQWQADTSWQPDA